MRFPNDTAFHLRMAAFVVFALFLEHLAERNLPEWSSPHIGILPFALGLLWVGLYAFHIATMLRQRIRVLEDRLDRLTDRADALEHERRDRRALPPL
ncbi:MAG: hypothetical protein KDC98_11265 [Planctomycetes bacterium]|nr:hypothetical protein [Planctomycetota bacterium]